MEINYDVLRATQARMARDKDPRSCNERLVAVGLGKEHAARPGAFRLFDDATGEHLATGDVVVAWAMIYAREDAAHG